MFTILVMNSKEEEAFIKVEPQKQWDQILRTLVNILVLQIYMWNNAPNYKIIVYFRHNTS